MTSRLATPDTNADTELRSILDSEHLSGFVVVAGAGSGKTTSLVKALAHLVEAHGSALRARTQRIACITYTEVAAQEIHGDVGNDPLVTVSTIHSFLWELVKPFQSDIRQWVVAQIAQRIADLKQKQASYGPGVRSATKEKDSAALALLEAQQEEVVGVARYSYSIASDYSRGVLGHEDILQIAPSLIDAKPLLPVLIARAYPYIFVDESQDTFPHIVQFLKKVAAQANGTVCLGFFGDPMQEIYMRSAGSIPLEEGWKRIDKPENFRSSKAVLQVVNAVRRDADGLVQVAGGSVRNELDGEAFVFVLPSDEHRSENLELVRAWLSKNSSAGTWAADADDTKILLITHRMAARRLGFGELYDAFRVKGGSGTLAAAFDEGTAWPLRPFSDVILPLCADHASDARTVAVLRRHSPLLADASSSEQVRARLDQAREAVSQMRDQFAAGGADSVRDVLRIAIESELIESDPRLVSYFGIAPTAEVGGLSETTVKTLDAFMTCDVRQLLGYITYINRESPYSTQHSTKGAEYRKVVVVLDDEEGRFAQYSYDKLFGLKELSATDKDHRAAGEDSAVERTRRLFYVCVSRAVEALAIVIFTHDVATAADAVRRADLGSNLKLLQIDDLEL